MPHNLKGPAARCSYERDPLNPRIYLPCALRARLC